MGRSLLNGLINNGFLRENLIAVEVDEDKRQQLKQEFGINVAGKMRGVVALADIVILAVKPQTMKDAVTALMSELSSCRPLLISIAAGVSLDSLAMWSAPDFAIIRAMPNTPALVNQAATAICTNSRVSETQVNFATGILSAVGKVVKVQDENMIDVVTALSGSGPAYFFYLLEIMEKTAIKLGLDADSARQLSQQTAFGAASMALQSRLEPEELRKQVTSPGGTTEAALKVMSKHNFAEVLGEAMTAAMQRSKELSQNQK